MIKGLKPRLLIQPFMTGLQGGVFRLFYVNRKFEAVVHTQWFGEEKVFFCTLLLLFVIGVSIHMDAKGTICGLH